MAQVIPGDAATDPAVSTYVAGDTAGTYRFVELCNGKTEWGPGSAARDVTLERTGAGQLRVAGSLAVSGDLSCDTAGGGLRVKTGADATAGTATLAAGTATVTTAKVTASSIILLTHQTAGGVPGAAHVSARTPGTSFTITGLATDTSTVGWLIVEPA